MPVSEPRIHPTAVVDPQARIDESVFIGPYCVIGPQVEIGAGTRLLAHVVIDGRTTIGPGNLMYPGVCIGFPPQAKPELRGTRAVIGSENVFREHVTVHTGSQEAGTVVGSRNLFMAGSHVGHDCRVADNIVMANQAALGGHVLVEENAVIGGLVGVHQCCRIGKLAMVGALTKTAQDALPFSITEGRPARLVGVNLVGLRRAGYSREAVRALHRAMREIRFSGARFRETLSSLRRQFPNDANIAHLIGFIEASKRGVARRPNGRSADDAEA